MIYHGKYWLPDIHNTSLFLAIGVFVPAIVETFLLQSMLIWSGHQSTSTYWVYVGSNLLSEFTTSLCLTLPALYYVTPFVKKKATCMNRTWKIQFHTSLPGRKR
jgi:membrane protein implicated in regulation of membrane protease activity